MALGLPARSRDRRVVAGVAGGMADGFKVNLMAVRLIWILLFLPGRAPGLLLYIIFWILMPDPGKK
ncbi:MAG: PspC domain-containing protein [Dehalococcoidia bacterium]